MRLTNHYLTFPGLLHFVCIVLLLLLIPADIYSQNLIDVGKDQSSYDKVRIYLNLGYVTSLTPGCTDCNKDSGASLRIGVLTKGRFGFYAGYAGYNVNHYEVTDYDDKGSALLLGADIRLIKKPMFQGYLQFGIASGQLQSTYHNSTRVETEQITIPQLGAIFHIRKFNAYIGMGFDRFNVGVGVTL